MDLTSGFTTEEPEDDLRKAVTHGAALGIPLVYLATLGMFMVAGSTLAGSAILALVPAIVGGPFFAGLAIILRDRVKAEAAEAGATHKRHHFPGIHIRHA